MHAARVHGHLMWRHGHVSFHHLAIGHHMLLRWHGVCCITLMAQQSRVSHTCDHGQVGKDQKHCDVGGMVGELPFFAGAFVEDAQILL